MPGERAEPPSERSRPPSGRMRLPRRHPGPPPWHHPVRGGFLQSPRWPEDLLDVHGAPEATPARGARTPGRGSPGAVGSLVDASVDLLVTLIRRGDDLIVGEDLRLPAAPLPGPDHRAPVRQHPRV